MTNKQVTNRRGRERRDSPSAFSLRLNTYVTGCPLHSGHPQHQHTLSTDTSDKQSDTIKTSEKQSRTTNLVTLETAFDKGQTDLLYCQRLPDFNNRKETQASLHEKRLTRIDVDPEVVRFRSWQRPNAEWKGKHPEESQGNNHLWHKQVIFWPTTSAHNSVRLTTKCNISRFRRIHQKQSAKPF